MSSHPPSPIIPRSSPGGCCGERRPGHRLLLQCFQASCRRLAASSAFSVLTTVLTLYALFGDDMRLLFTEKPSDPIFDGVTVACIVIFAIEILACSVGKAGYFLGFFFWLDLASTMTLLVDITPVAERLLGDSISNADGDSTSTSGRSAGGDSAEAARAARMSRAGTKAGGVVRLIRLVRLLRLVRNYRKDALAESRPGFEWGEGGEEDQDVAKESAVSKKLSEMTTRRVIMLVLVIMLLLPFFQPSVYTDKLPSSAQYGINVLYRRWISDMLRFVPMGGIAREQAYLGSRERRVYADDFHMYVYYHNPLCESSEVPPDKTASPLSSFGKLFWLGAGPTSAVQLEWFLPGRPLDAASDLNSRWNGADWNYYMCNLTANPAGLLNVSWLDTRLCVADSVRGISLLKDRDPRVACPEDLRYQERAVVYPNLATDAEWDTAFFMFVFDRRSGSRMEALLNTAQTIFICFLLGFGAMTFSSDANKLVLAPIERMVSKLDKIRSSPLEATNMGDEEHRREQAAEAAAAAQRRKRTALVDGDGGRLSALRDRLLGLLDRLPWRAPLEQPEPMETVVLEKTIVKIGSLLALGFGEAGAEIIGQNMQGGDSSALNAMVPGRRVEAIFGFCDIRNFTDATEVLQDQVMVFVNQIASVVHSVTNEYFGSPNKNSGNAFLLAWRLSGHPPEKQQRLADMALVALVKIIAQINRSHLLAEYRNHPKLTKRLRVESYHVRMGFGLHSGWAIEGAIGSEFKIDASYLSPNVNMASRLESATKLYGCVILLSDAITRQMSEMLREECRLIDHVRMEGTRKPLKLYTLDLDDAALVVLPTRKNEGSRIARLKRRLERQRKKAERWSDDFVMHDFFATETDIVQMREKFTTEFFARFHMAYLNYEAGEWEVAQRMLQVVRTSLGAEDGPSAALLRYMKRYGNTTPKGWPGYRLLTERCAT
mmetsp:Transcript_24063/g.74800  ORF Transcript_24063/g.74800 Transcript_24063/m.74800 type:complete len:943 (-) Transcript_24063:56-2884(-)